MYKNVTKQIKNRELTGEKIKINQHWVKDTCIICKKDTPYTVATKRCLRRHYAESIGQMCPSCYYATYSHAMVNDEFIQEIFS